MFGIPCKYTIPKIRNKYSQKGIAPSVPIPTFMFLWAIYTVYSQDQSTYSAAGKKVDRSLEYIHSSQTHECGNGDWGPAFSFLGLHTWDFRGSVHHKISKTCISNGTGCPKFKWQFLMDTKKCQSPPPDPCLMSSSKDICIVSRIVM
jgi:hypothetical protein